MYLDLEVEGLTSSCLFRGELPVATEHFIFSKTTVDPAQESQQNTLPLLQTNYA